MVDKCYGVPGASLAFKGHFDASEARYLATAYRRASYRGSGTEGSVL